MNATPIRLSLSRKDAALVALGVVAWMVIGLGGAWLYHQLTRLPGDCGTAVEGKATSTRSTPGGPRNGLQLLTGTGRCR